MTVTPVPVLAVGGVDVAAGPDPGGAWPGLMALDGAGVKWGRADVLAQPTPAMASFGVFDPAGTWATSTDLIGQPVTVRWTVPGESHVYFRGRIASVDLQRKTARGPAREFVPGVLVKMTATSVLTDLGNRRPADPGTAWPAETLAARRARIAAQVSPQVTAVATRADWDAAPLAAVDSPGESKLLELLTRLYVNCGADRFTFDPDTCTVDWLARRTFPATSAAHLARDSSRTGVYVAGPEVQRTPADPVQPAVSIPASSVEYDGGVGRTMDSRLTRVTLAYPGTVSKGFTALTPGLDEAVLGVRSLDVDTEHTDDTQALAAVNDLSAMAAGEASGWALQPMTWDTTRAGNGFASVDQVRLLLAGAERSGVFWLSGSWLPAVGILPLFGVMGGTITCKRGGWVIDWSVAPTSVTGGPVAGFAWDDLDPSIVWTDDDDPNGFHSSVTLDDLAAVGTGAITNGP